LRRRGGVGGSYAWLMSPTDEHLDATGAASPGNDPLLADLTGPQREAVLHTEGPLLVLAAAGSGKTRAITRRIAHLVRCGIPPWSIMALTFTNKAAAEMRERVAVLLGAETRATRGLTVTTFHSLSARLLRRYADVAGLPGLKPDFTIYDSSDQAAMVKKVLEHLGLASSNWPPRSVLSAISSAKNELMDAGAYEAQSGDFYTKTVAKIYNGYQAALRAANAVDFDDLLLLTAKMLKESAAVREECRRRWQYLMVDEYQDTNRAQFVIAALIAGGSGEVGGTAGVGTKESGTNICVVGDPDQAIYAWRGADITNILDFERQYPGCRVITLGENFRSDAPILAAADTLIRNNKQRKHKDLFTRRAGGEKVQVVHCRDERHEAQLITDWFKRLHHDEGAAWREMAVFYRTNALSRVMEDALRGAALPYVIARGTAFFEREEIKNALGYLRLIANPADEVSLLRVINTPTRGIGDTSIGSVEVYAAQNGITLMEAFGRAEQVPGLSARARGSIHKFMQTIDAWTGAGTFLGAGVSETLADLVERVIKESGLERMYEAQAKAGKSENDLERTDNLDELVSSARQFELEYDPEGDPANGTGVVQTAGDGAAAAGGRPHLLAMLRGYLESVSLVADADMVDAAHGAITLMTLHAAKGLEFPAVAMIGLEEGLLPHSRARESEPALEEERRLAFVGITRAMRKLHITSAKYRTIRGISERTIPSRFLDELGHKHVAVSDQADPLDGLDERWTAGPDEWPTIASARPAARASAERGAGGSAAAKFPVGALVRHPQFGTGKILGVTGGNNARAQIQFKDVGTKTLVLEYARLERI